MNLQTMLPELNDNQRKWLERTLLEIVAKSREKSLPIKFIEDQVKELFT